MTFAKESFFLSEAQLICDIFFVSKIIGHAVCSGLKSLISYPGALAMFC